ncbi:pilus assembly protein [bacterium]|nr:pilus assembly protein [bacterium]
MKLARQDGAAAVEFAIISILLFMLLFGIIEMSIALYDNAKVADAARTGVRSAANYKVDPDTEIYEHLPSTDPGGGLDICSIVEEEMKLAITFGSTTSPLPCGSTLQGSGDAIQVIWCTDPTDCANSQVPEANVDGYSLGIPLYVEVTVRYGYDFLVLPGFIPILGDSIDMTRRSRMRLERGT